MIYGIAENPRPTGKCVEYTPAAWEGGGGGRDFFFLIFFSPQKKLAWLKRVMSIFLFS